MKRTRAFAEVHVPRARPAAAGLQRPVARGSCGYRALVLLLAVWGQTTSAQPLPATAEKQPATEGAFSITTEDQFLFRAERRGRFLVIQLRGAHRVLSTSTWNGGLSDQVTHLVNFQSMEARGDSPQLRERLALGSRGYHRAIAAELNLSPKSLALLGTAAHMGLGAHVARSFRGLRVDAFVTAGVHENALRAGDPARWVQTAAGYERVPEQGTINVIVVVNQPLASGALAKAAAVLTEAKAAALSELAVGSRYSAHLATGTGTDQYAIATPIEPRKLALESASQHLKLGELIGDAVRSATLEALRLQNGLAPSATGDAMHALGRFGLTTERIQRDLSLHLKGASLEIARQNLRALLHEPRLVAAAFAYAAVLDRLQYGTLPPSSAREVLRDQAATVATALALAPGRWHELWQRLAPEEDDAVALFVQALALGFEAKWSPPPRRDPVAVRRRL